jgi:hypothetical protein
MRFYRDQTAVAIDCSTACAFSLVVTIGTAKPKTSSRRFAYTVYLCVPYDS